MSSSVGGGLGVRYIKVSKTGRCNNFYKKWGAGKKGGFNKKGGCLTFLLS